MTSWLSFIKRLHGDFVSGRRTRVLAHAFATHLPKGASVLDVGCGDGTIAQLLVEHDPTLIIQGLEVAPRPACAIACTVFDGKRIPYADASFDVCLFVDVLHHTADAPSLLREACRVARRFILIKDHLCENRFDWWTLKLMDWVGNRPHGVLLRYAYMSRGQWRQLFVSCGLQPVAWEQSLPLQFFPLSLLFGRGLHYVAMLRKNPTG